MTGDGNEAGADTPLEKLEKGLQELRLRGRVTTAQEGTERERPILEWAGKAKKVAWSGPRGYFLAPQIIPQCAEKAPRSLRISCSLVGPLADTS